MATRIAEMVAELESRAEELRPLAAELQEVEAALAALKSVTASPDLSPTREGSGTARGRARKRAAGGSGSRPKRGRSAQPSGQRSGRRAPRGERREQVLQAVANEPGIASKDVAERIGLTASQVHGIVSRLVKEGALQRADGTLRPAAAGNGAGATEVAQDPTATE